MITDNERREVARKLREPKESLLAYPDEELIRLRRETGCPRGQDFYEHLADLIDRPMCHDLVEHEQDPFIPGKRMTDGYFHCSNCDWDGRLWEHIGFGDMLAYEPVHCPKCGKEIKR